MEFLRLVYIAAMAFPWFSTGTLSLLRTFVWRNLCLGSDLDQYDGNVESMKCRPDEYVEKVSSLFRDNGTSNSYQNDNETIHNNTDVEVQIGKHVIIYYQKA